jgi:hypothetical protein
MFTNIKCVRGVMAAHLTIQLRGDVRFNPNALLNFYGKG